jgi:hypothetical protein
MDPIDLVPTESLLRELRRRFDTMVFLGAATKTSDMEDVTVSFDGQFHSVLGLAELGKTAIMQGISDDSDRPSD